MAKKYMAEFLTKCILYTIKTKVKHPPFGCGKLL